MAERTFYEEKSRQEATLAVKAIESQTAAEIVVALRKSSGYYRAADFACGCLLALLALGAMLLVPRSFRMWAVPIDLLVAFAIGVAMSAGSSTLRRLLTRPSRRREFVRGAARTTFMDLGVSRTSGRWGVLVYLSMLERDAEIVPDVGIDLPAMGEEWARAVATLREAMGRMDFAAFHTALLALGPILGKAHPRREDDVNELPDEVSAS